MHKAFFFVKSKNPNQSCTGRLQRSVGGGKINYFVEKHFYRGASATYRYEISGRGQIEIKKSSLFTHAHFPRSAMVLSMRL